MKPDPKAMKAVYDGICCITGVRFKADDDVVLITGKGLARIPPPEGTQEAETTPVVPPAPKPLEVHLTDHETVALKMVHSALSTAARHGYQSVGGVVSVSALVVMHLADGKPEDALIVLQTYIAHMRRIA